MAKIWFLLPFIELGDFCVSEGEKNKSEMSDASEMSLNSVSQENNFYTDWDFDPVWSEKCVQDARFIVQGTSSTFSFFSWGNSVFPNCTGISAVWIVAHEICRDEMSCKAAQDVFTLSQRRTHFICKCCCCAPVLHSLLFRQIFFF